MSIIGFLFLLWILWAIVSAVVSSIGEKREDKHILRLGTKDKIFLRASFLADEHDVVVKALRNETREFSQYLYDSFPGLKERIERDHKRKFYINFILPSKNEKRKKNNYGYRR